MNFRLRKLALMTFYSLSLNNSIHIFNRYGNSDYKRERYDSYNNRTPGYHRDHRDRDRDRRVDKRR